MLVRYITLTPMYWMNLLPHRLPAHKQVLQYTTTLLSQLIREMLQLVR